MENKVRTITSDIPHLNDHPLGIAASAYEKHYLSKRHKISLAVFYIRAFLLIIIVVIAPFIFLDTFPYL